MLQDSEEELPDMSDEQMFKMDKLLAAVLRTQKDAKDRSKTTKQVGLGLKPLSTLSHIEKFWVCHVKKEQAILDH